MKKKIFAMLLASLLISFSATACDSSELPEILDCPGHVDADNNGYCENCSIGVIKIVETTPATPEEYKEMVVNAIPEGGKLADFINLPTEEFSVIKSNATLTEIEGYSNLTEKSYDVIKIGEENVDTLKFFDSYEIYNTLTNEKIYSFVTTDYEDKNTINKEKVTITKNDYFFLVVEKTYNGISFDYDYKTKMIDYNGKVIAEVEGDHTLAGHGIYAGINYFNLKGKVYAFDIETGALLLKDQDPNLLIERPAFDLVIDKTGYIVNSSKVYTYDISTWFETSFVYSVPSYLENASINILTDGKILVQGYKNLSDNAVNYDVIIDGAKYDVVQYVVDPATGAEKALEFGYIINKFDNAYTSELELVKENTNIVTISPIVNKAIDNNNQFTVIIDSDLKILYSYKPTVLGQIDELPIKLSDTRFLATVQYGDGTTAKIIVDEKGELVKYLPNNAEIKNGYIQMGNEIYDYDLTLELVLNNYNVVSHLDNGAMILSYQDEVEDGVFETIYYYFDVTNNTKELLGENEVLKACNSNYYVVEKTTIEINEEAATEEEREVEVKTYLVYNVNCELVATFDAPITSIQLICDGVYKVVSNDKTYILK